MWDPCFNGPCIAKGRKKEEAGGKTLLGHHYLFHLEIDLTYCIHDIYLWAVSLIRERSGWECWVYMILLCMVSLDGMRMKGSRLRRTFVPAVWRFLWPVQHNTSTHEQDFTCKVDCLLAATVGLLVTALTRHNGIIITWSTAHLVSAQFYLDGRLDTDTLSVTIYRTYVAIIESIQWEAIPSQETVLWERMSGSVDMTMRRTRRMR